MRAEIAGMTAHAVRANTTAGIVVITIALLTLSLPALTTAQEKPAKPRASGTNYEIQLQSRKFTPRAGVPADLAGRIKREISSSQPANRRAHVLVQLEAPVEPADRQRLAKEGILLLEQVTRLTWYAAVSDRGADLLARTAGVRWAELIRPDDKLARTVQKDAPVLPYHTRPANRIAYSVLFHKDVTAAEVADLARRIGAELENFEPDHFPVVRTVTLNIPRDQLAALVREDIVAWVDAAPPPDRPGNLLNAQPLSNVNRVQAAPFNLDGTGIAVGVWEAGPGVVFAGHLDLTPRITVEAGQTATNTDHASHVAGTIGASGANVPNARGMAPNVAISSWDSGNDANEMTNAATSVGGAGQPVRIQVSNHSYSSIIGWNNAGTVFNNNQNLFGQYTAQSVGFDNVVLQTGLIVVKSAGNDRNDAPAAPVPGQPADCFQGGLGVAADCLDPRASAKNVITVGAMNGAGAIAAFSNFGPTDDGRIKPDLMAHGVNLRSLACNCFDDQNADGVDDVANSNVANTTMSGTSMAAPVVAGIVALVLQEADTRNMALSPAAVKALLIQTARDVQGIGQSRIGPDFATGWGIVDAEAAINLLRQAGVTQGVLNATGVASAWTRNFFVPAGQNEIHLTLAWDDPAGNPGGQILINDLDLRLIAPNGTQFTPWVLNAANPALGAVRNGGNDAVNNVEQVSVLNPIAGVWTAQVSANAGNLPQGPQTFAVAGLLPHSDVMLVMDRSGSMSLSSGTPGITKIQALQNAANELIDLLDLGGGHRLGLVQFQETVVPFVPAFDLQALADTNVPNAHTAINSVTSGGNTNIISGVNAAATQLAAAAPPFPRQSIVVFSDGKHNRPIGSNLSSINATVQAGNFRFYSIGFGTDVDDAILSDVANANGGLHVNEQDLSPIQLTKYFLTVGALTHDMAVLADPTYQLSAGQAATLAVGVSRMDQSFTFAVNWTGQHAGSVHVGLTGPNPNCAIPLVDQGRVRVRTGQHYRLVRVQLPLHCNGTRMHEGSWTITARADDVTDKGQETVDIMVLGESRLKLDAKMHLLKDSSRLNLTAMLLQDGKPLPKTTQGIVEAHVRLPQPATNDSAKQDGTRKTARPAKTTLATDESRILKIQLSDNGKDGDLKAGDGVFSAAVDIAKLPRGLLQVRFVSNSVHNKQKIRREATTSAYINR